METTGMALAQMMRPMPHALSVYWQGWRATEYVNSMAQRRHHEQMMIIGGALACAFSFRAAY
jgi:hypothetical protein